VVSHEKAVIVEVESMVGARFENCGTIPAQRMRSSMHFIKVY
jgi:hypothetical protein